MGIGDPGYVPVRGIIRRFAPDAALDWSFHQHLVSSLSSSLVLSPRSLPQQFSPTSISVSALGKSFVASGLISLPSDLHLGVAREVVT